MKEPVRHKWIISIAVMLGTMMEIIDASIINVAIPDMMGNLGATLDEITLVVNGYIVANVIIIPLSGWLSIRFGRKRYFMFSIALFTVSSFFCGFLNNLYLLVLARIIQGIGGGALVPMSQAILMETFPPEEQGTATSIFGLGMMAGPTLGPTLGGWITDNYSWPWIFYINVPLGILAFFLVLFFIEDPAYLKPTSPRVDYTGFILLAIGIGCLQTLLEKGEREDWFESNFIIWLTILAILALPLFIWRELRIDYPIVNLRVLANRSFCMGTIFSMIIGFGLYGSNVLISVYFQNLLHYSSWETGKVVFYAASTIALMMPISGKLVNKVPPRYMVGAGACFFALAIYRMSHFTLETQHAEVFWTQVIRGIGLGLSFVPLNIISLRTLDKKDIPAASGIYNLMRQLGGSFGIAILVTLLTRGESIHRANLIQHVNLLNPLTVQRLNSLEQGLLVRGEPKIWSVGYGTRSMESPPCSSLFTPCFQQGTLKLLDLAVNTQASMLAFIDAFRFIVILTLLSLPLLFLFKKR